MLGSPMSALLDLTAEPGATAIIDHGTRWTRGELAASATQLAFELERTVQADCRIGVRDTQDAWTIVNIIASLLSGRPLVLFSQDDSEISDAAAMARCPVILAGSRWIPLSQELCEDPLLLPSYGTKKRGSPESVVLYTSGTTSRPRGVRLAAQSIASNLTAMDRFAPSWRDNDRFGMVLALNHSFGLSMTMLALRRKVPIVMLGGGVPSRATVLAAHDNRVTILACVPYYLRILRTRSLAVGRSFAPDLRTILFAGGGVSDRELGLLLEGFEGTYALMYGCTEAAARVAVRRSVDGAPEDSVGLPLPGCSVDIVDGAGQVAPVGEIGRIRISSPSLMLGYLGEAVREAGSSLITTDLGRVDEFGNLTVTGRQAEMLNFRGNRVSVVSVEAITVAIDGVRDARLIPESSDEDSPCCLQVVAAERADHKRIRREVLRVINPRGLISRVQFIDRLEFTRSGKPVRRTIADGGD